MLPLHFFLARYSRSILGVRPPRRGMLHVTKAGHGKICKHYVVNANLIKDRVVSSVLSMLAKHEKTDSELQHFGHTLEGST